VRDFEEMRFGELRADGTLQELGDAEILLAARIKELILDRGSSPRYTMKHEPDQSDEQHRRTD
jgi:hypothetical protein